MSRLKKLEKMGILEEFLWEEQYDEPRPGYFARLREEIETMSEEDLFDLWCRGQNLMGYASLILRRVDQLRKVMRGKQA